MHCYLKKNFNTTHYHLLFLVLLLSSFTTACVNFPSAEQRWQNTLQLAKNSTWHSEELATDPFNLTVFQPDKQKALNGVLTVYIEGDGLAWLTPTMISPNPTPINPIGLMLALKHRQNDAVVYLARPCQYVVEKDKYCHNKYWTSHRFSLEVIQAMNMAINKLKLKANAKHIQLIGYSGGGTLAALITAQRNDVVLLLTVASNLDHKAWTQHHKVSPLTGSLNPAVLLSSNAEWQKLKKIPQMHFSGAQDHIVPIETIAAYKNHFNKNNIVKFRSIPDADHFCCWVEKWPELLNEALLFSESNKK